VPYLVGAGLALFVCGVLGTLVGLDRDRAFYVTATIVIASYYVLFAVMGGSTGALVAEIAIGSLFAAGALVGFKRDMRIVAVLLAGHGVLDAFHGGLVRNPGVPAWWPPFCLAFDVVAGVWLWVLLKKRGRPASG
jgi:hypothetical protein